MSTDYTINYAIVRTIMAELSIIHEDENILVIDKPSGVVMHPFDFSKEETLLDMVERHSSEIFLIENPKKLQDGRVINLGGMVHKLDRETSGVVVFAKNKKTFEELSNQFKTHTIEKTYYARVSGSIKETIFTINAPLAREKKSYKQSVNPKEFRGELRDAITTCEVLCTEDEETIIKLIPKTGRTHQLRAHMAHIGHPIIGDIVYGGKRAERIMLHAQKISFFLNSKKETFESMLPETFRCPQ